ncbi:hypothetical protein JCM8547_001468 [Rhodosporidiobolus lusitaniae]
MPPRRSTRSTKSQNRSPASPSSSSSKKSSFLDLAGQSFSPPPSKKRRTRARKDEEQEEDSDSEVEILSPASSSKKGKAKRGPVHQQDNEEEDQLAGQNMLPIASSSTFSSTSRRSSRPSTAVDPTHPPPAFEPFEDDPNDPRVVVRANREVLVGGEGTCKCGEKVKVEEKKEGTPLTPTSSLETYLSLASTTCSSCSTLLCRGCWASLPNDEGKGSGECCAESRVIVLFELLSALDDVYLTDHLAKPAPSASPSPTNKGTAKGKKKAAAPKTTKGKGKGKGKATTIGAGAGTGYGSGSGAVAAYYAGSYGYAGGAAAGASNGTGYALPDDDDYEFGYDSEMDYEEWEAMKAAERYGSENEDEDDWMHAEFDEEGFEEWRAERRREREARKPKPAPPVINTHDATQDALYLRLLTLLRPLLPSPDSPAAHIFDFLPHPLLPALLSLSTLPDLLAQLLRNDAVPEWVRRSEVYFAMLGVVEALGGSEGTLGGVFGERREKKWSEGVGRFVKGEGDVKWERKRIKKVVGEPEPEVKKGRGRKRKAVTQEEEVWVEEGDVVMGVPLFTLLRKLSTQAEAFRRAAASGSFGVSDGEGGETDAALLGICGDFASAGERCGALSKVWEEKQERERAEKGPPSAAGGGGGGEEQEEGGRKTRSKGKGKAKEEELGQEGWTENDYETACGKLAYDVVEMSVDAAGGGKTFPSHHYHCEIAQSANARRSHASFVHLAKELAVLSTSLPPGIWVRVDEARVDVLKCLIAGPEDSPYAGGLFEFDIFIPLEYPQVSPLCWLRTTGGNQCRFNPNLYAEGKVCLSLLGTWSGAPEEMWQPEKSTILQVLLSITSMILGTNFPYFNEPGYGAPRDTVQNQTYNKNVSLATTRWAILDWIEGDKFKDSIWIDIIASHFLLRRPLISSTLSSWAAKDPRMRKWTPSLNATAGTDKLEPFSYARYYAELNAADGVGAGGSGSGGGAGGKKAKGKGKKSAKEEEKPAGLAERDLVKEVEAALDRLEGWKEVRWLEGMAKPA